MKALRDMNLGKFVFEDVPLFESLISDLCPGISINKADTDAEKEKSFSYFIR